MGEPVSFSIVLAIAGFIIVLLLGIIGFFLRYGLKKLDGQYFRIEGWVNTIRDMISNLKERIDEGNLNTRLNQEAIGEIRREVQNKLNDQDKEIDDVRRVVIDHEKRISEIDKRLSIQKHVHNDLHPTRKIEE